MKPITVITDPGVDDVIALVLLQKLAAKQRKVLVSTFGNVSAALTAKNTRDFAAYMPGKWEYRPGATLPYGKKVELPWADYFHGADGLWGVRPPAATKLLRRPSSPDLGDVFSLGPLTEPLKLLKATKRLCIMGGAFNKAGNEASWSEFNMAMDVDAAKLLFERCAGIDVRLVPLDATNKVKWSLKDVQAIPETNSTNRWLKQLLLAWFQGYKSAATRSFELFDPLAVYLAFVPEAAIWKRSGVAVADKGPQRGRTVFSDANPPCNIAIDIKEPEKVAQRILSLVFEVEP